MISNRCRPFLICRLDYISLPNIDGAKLTLEQNIGQSLGTTCFSRGKSLIGVMRLAFRESDALSLLDAPFFTLSTVGSFHQAMGRLYRTATAPKKTETRTNTKQRAKDTYLHGGGGGCRPFGLRRTENVPALIERRRRIMQHARMSSGRKNILQVHVGSPSPPRQLQRDDDHT